jgi:hypothetical protein
MGNHQRGNIIAGLHAEIRIRKCEKKAGAFTITQ